MISSLTRVCITSLLLAYPAALYAADTNPIQGSGVLGQQIIQQISQRARQTVVAVVGDNGHASAILALEDHDNWYFLTCYHVMNAVRGFGMEAELVAGKTQRIDVTDAKFYSDSMRDLAIIRTPKLANLNLVPLFPNGLQGVRVAGVGSKEEMLALGFPGFQKDVTLYESKVRVSQEDLATEFGLIPHTDKDNPLFLRSVQEEPTIAGMSGGAVLDSQFQFAGLVVARIPDTVSFVIAPRTVLRTLSEAMASPQRFQNFAGANFHQWPSSPYPESFQRALTNSLQTEGVVDTISRDLASRWQELFKSGSTFRERFQNVEVDLPRLVSPKPHVNVPGAPTTGKVVLRIEDETFRDAPDGFVRVWINGHPRSVSKADANPTCDIKLDDELAPNRNLIVLSRKNNAAPVQKEASAQEVAHADSASNAAFRVNRLFQSMPVQASIWCDGARIYTIHRELPALFDSYSVDLELISPEVGSHPNAAAGNVTLAINLSRAAALVSAKPVRYAGTLQDSSGRSRVEAAVEPDPKSQFIIFERVNDQAVSVRVNAIVALTSFSAEYAGLRFKPAGNASHDGNNRPAFAPRAAWVRGNFLLLECVPPAHGIRTAFRLCAGNAGPIPLPLTADVEVDAGIPVSELLLAQMNAKLDGSWVQSEIPTELTPDKLRAALEQVMPGVLPAEVAIDVVGARVSDDGWLYVDLNLGVNAAAPKSRPQRATVQASESGTDTACVFLHGVDDRILKEILSKWLSDKDPGLLDALTHSIADGQIHVDVNVPERPEAAIAVTTGDLRPWLDGFRTFLGRSTSVQMKLGAADFQEGVARELRGVKVTLKDPGAQAGAVAVAIDENGVHWKTSHLISCADLLDLGPVQLKNVTVNTGSMDFVQGRLGSLQGEIHGTISIDSLETGGFTACSSLTGDCDIKLERGNSEKSKVKVANIRGTIAGRRLSGGSSDLVLNDGQVTGTISFGPLQFTIDR